MGLKLHPILSMARVGEGTMAEDAVVITAVVAETTTVHLKAITSTLASHTLLIITLLNTALHIHLLVVILLLSLNGALSMDTHLMDTHKVLSLPTTTIPITPLSHTHLLNTRNNPPMAVHRPTPIQGHLLLRTKPSGMVVGSRL
jgi:hypothetical protein